MKSWTSLVLIDVLDVLIKNNAAAPPNICSPCQPPMINSTMLC